MEEGNAFAKMAEEQKVSLDSLIQGETITPDTYEDMFSDKGTPIFDGVVQEHKQQNKGIPINPKEAYEDIENKKRFVKNLNPEYKAHAVYAGMLKNPEQYPNVPRVGHGKRIFLRKLIRDAKKGKLDRFFL